MFEGCGHLDARASAGRLGCNKVERSKGELQCAMEAALISGIGRLVFPSFTSMRDSLVRNISSMQEVI